MDYAAVTVWTEPSPEAPSGLYYEARCRTREPISLASPELAIELRNRSVEGTSLRA
jgi:hypothetical protein